jgi:shikimate dehydrogenase
MADRGADVHRAAVLGSPIAHSLSPALHRAAYAGLALPWTYEAIEVDEAGLPAFLTGLDGTWAGLSLTMPLKEAVIPLLSEVDEEARALRAVNTVLPGADGWRGTNTDVYGIVEALLTAGLAGQPNTATVLGAGATARSAVAALVRLGVGDVIICARRQDAAQEVAALASSFGIVASTRDLGPELSVLATDIVISTLPGDAGAPWALLAPDARGALLDASYHPWPTPLAQAWGSPVVASGRDMLLWQAVEQVRLMTGLEPPAELMSAALPA